MAGALNLHTFDQTSEVAHILTVLRDKCTDLRDFVFYADRLTRLLVEKSLSLLEYEKKTVMTSTGCTFEGVALKSSFFGVSILRSGEAMEKSLRECCRGVRIGKILLQKNHMAQNTNESHQPKLYYYKLPSQIENSTCLLLDPMLASGNSATLAVKLLIHEGIPASRIIFVCVIASAQGIAKLNELFPDLKIVCAHCDEKVNEAGWILPGLGDFGDRYFGTERVEY